MSLFVKMLGTNEVIFNDSHYKKGNPLKYDKDFV